MFFQFFSKICKIGAFNKLEGTAATCGVNKNEKSCDCKTQAYDERWEGLEQLSASTPRPIRGMRSTIWTRELGQVPL